MSRYVLVPGAGGGGWDWSRGARLLQAAGHDGAPGGPPADDPVAGLSEYARLVVDAIDGEADVVLVGQSLGGFTLPLVCERVAVRALVLTNAMIPQPGETPAAWWDHV